MTLGFEKEKNIKAGLITALICLLLFFIFFFLNWELPQIPTPSFGEGIEEDAFGTRLLASKFPEMFIAASCSKNFGIYRERCGIVITVSKNPDISSITQGNLSYVNRQNFSFPPDHGARLVTMVLTDPDLRADWVSELEQVRVGMLDARTHLAEALRKECNSNRFDFLEHQSVL